MFPFERPKDYSEMLNKIGMLTWIEAILLMFLVGHYVSKVDVALRHVQVPVKVFEVEVPVLYAVPGTLIAILARVFRLHDCISNLCRIRERFDVEKILVPLSTAVGIDVPVGRFREKRVVAMRRAFYEYASFEEPKISKALVLSAIDTWTWYWALLELIFLLLVTSLVLTCFKAFMPGIFVAVSALALTLLFLTVFRTAGKKAQYQLDEITSDSGRAGDIKEVFKGLQTNPGN